MKPEEFKNFSSMMKKYEEEKKEAEELKEFKKYKAQKIKQSLPEFPKLQAPAAPASISTKQINDKELRHYIHKKAYVPIALGYLKEIQTLQLGAIIALFATLVLSIFNMALGMGAVLIGVVGLAWWLRKTKGEIATIQQKAKLGGYL